MAKAKTYHGFRDAAGTCYIEVRQPDQLGKPLKHEEHHSPTGFEWGYGGSGPADTARSILADHLGFVPSPAFYQRFKFAVVGNLDRDAWTLTTADINLAIDMLKVDMGIDCLRCADRGMIWPDKGPNKVCSCIGAAVGAGTRESRRDR